MEKKNNFRARVMKYAWQLWRATKQQWRICMLKAWQLYRLAKGLRENEVTFYYQKADGSIRKAIGTLKGVSGGAKKITKPSYKTMTYFDIEKQDFRCFKIENFILSI